MSGRIHVHGVGLDDCTWGFRDGTPRFQPRIADRHRYAAACTLDPFPAYPHDMAVTMATVMTVETAFPPLWDVHLFVADREEIGRTNGFSALDIDHYADGDGEKPKTGVIFLAGKRIPPHPAMTRHLVAHEYGHNVEWMLEYLRNPERLQRDDVMKEYAELRGVAARHGSGGNWHDSATEVFACDFRILVCGVEPEYWPHPGVDRPETCPEAVEWWQARWRERLSAA